MLFPVFRMEKGFLELPVMKVDDGICVIHEVELGSDDFSFDDLWHWIRGRLRIFSVMAWQKWLANFFIGSNFFFTFPLVYFLLFLSSKYLFILAISSSSYSYSSLEAEVALSALIAF